MAGTSKTSVAAQARLAALLGVGLAAGLSAVLAGCGQKGPLVLPASPAQAAGPATAPAPVPVVTPASAPAVPR